METAICGRLALSPTRVIHPKPGDKYALQKQWTSRSNVRTVPIAGVGKGGGVLDKPVIEKTTPGRESEFDLKIDNEFAMNSVRGKVCLLRQYLDEAGADAEH